MSFVPCENCGRPTTVRGLCAQCSDAVNETTEALDLMAMILGENVSPAKKPGQAGARETKV